MLIQHIDAKGKSRKKTNKTASKFNPRAQSLSLIHLSGPTERYKTSVPAFRWKKKSPKL